MAVDGFHCRLTRRPCSSPRRDIRRSDSRPARPDVPAKCAGRYQYIQDFTVPRHAPLPRDPAAGDRRDARVGRRGLDRALPGVRVVRIESFLAVVAEDEWAAVRASRELKATWTDWRGLPGHDNLERYLRDGVVERDQAIVHRGPSGPIGDADPSGAALEAALASAKTKLTATYFWPCQSHASLAPSCAVADVRGDVATIWTSSQVTYGLRATLSRVFGLAPEKMRVVFIEGSGSYGTNRADHAAADALLVAKTLGKPVRVQWSRQDEHGWESQGPQQLLDLRAGLDPAGRIVAWDTQMWIPTNRRGARILLAAQAAGIPQDGGRDAAGVFENGDPAYPPTIFRVLAHWMRDTPLNPSNLRAPGKPANVFAVESFADEMAASLRVDALEFRTARLPTPRARRVSARVGGVRLAVEAVAESWRAREGPAVGRGVAYTRYKQAENYIAMFMEVAVDPRAAASPCGASSAPTTAASSSTPRRCGIRSRARSCRRSAARCTKKCSSTSHASRAWTGRPIRF